MRTYKGIGVSLNPLVFKRITKRVEELGISRSAYIQLAIISEMDHADRERREAKAERERSNAVNLGIKTPIISPKSSARRLTTK